LHLPTADRDRQRLLWNLYLQIYGASNQRDHPWITLESLYFNWFIGSNAEITRPGYTINRLLLDGGLAERRQDSGHVFHERAVGAHYENAFAFKAFAMVVEQPRSTVKSDCCLASSGTTLNNQQAIRRRRD